LASLNGAYHFVSSQHERRFVAARAEVRSVRHRGLHAILCQPERREPRQLRRWFPILVQGALGFPRRGSRPYQHHWSGCTRVASPLRDRLPVTLTTYTRPGESLLLTGSPGLHRLVQASVAAFTQPSSKIAVRNWTVNYGASQSRATISWLPVSLSNNGESSGARPSHMPQ